MMGASSTCSPNAKGDATKPWAVQFDGARKSFVSPFDRSSSVFEANVPAAHRKRCIGGHGDWSLMLDVLTKECFLLSFTSHAKIPLPPLLDLPKERLDLIFNCALSSQTPPDCTVMVAVCRGKSLLYCRPNDSRWSLLPINSFNGCEDDADEFDVWGTNHQERLMPSSPHRKKRFLDVFDLVSKKKYSINVSIPLPTAKDDTGSQILHFAKNGWLVLSRGNHSFFLVNPFKNSPDNAIVLPPEYHSPLPGSPDFVVVTTESVPSGTVVTIKTWRIGDEDWKEESFENDVPFFMASHNPVFFEGDFYCLDVNARLGVFNPDTMEWSVLDEPDPIPMDDDGEQLCFEYGYKHLVEWKGELLAFFRDSGAEDGSISLFKLDRTQMVWSVLDGLKDGIMFWDRKNVVARSAPPGEDHLCNKMFLPNFTESDGGGREHAFYCLEKKEYDPCFYGLKEPINRIWFEPNLDYLQ
ncbi:hypothetical protein E2562_018418 [Oryza meyeriana var. granulata]|uniref:KIB1-4 beta-propeller domain-containing protein n=1 Tax=Oryza meyeriana var. granulata TaxID=110450 RepID=A0A6G1D5G0_9ORYZ|nr:hypothetical protein E2562_018418 [Oryza meyeriana var. granulata]